MCVIVCTNVTPLVTDADTVRELKKQRISIDDFSVKEVIGRGHFGEVKVVREKMTGDVFALKVLRKVDTLAQQNVSGDILTWNHAQGFSI